MQLYPKPTEKVYLQFISIIWNTKQREEERSELQLPLLLTLLGMMQPSPTMVWSSWYSLYHNHDCHDKYIKRWKTKFVFFQLLTRWKIRIPPCPTTTTTSLSWSSTTRSFSRESLRRSLWGKVSNDDRDDNQTKWWWNYGNGETTRQYLSLREVVWSVKCTHRSKIIPEVKVLREWPGKPTLCATAIVALE